ncbi:MAG TPA: hypothetical protein VFH22_01280 [Rhodocyclaceae bacterium]|nr:hypothetical protein [Rhodocyclaceae bacterium]
MTHLQKFLAHAAALSLAGALALLSGCATIVGDERTSLPIKSTPADAQILIIDEAGRTAYRGRTPDQVPLRKSDGHYWGGKQFTVAISKRGYQTQRIQVDTRPNALYLGGNLLFGGIIGWLMVDPISGKMYDLSSEGIEVTLQKSPYEAPTAAAAPSPIITATPLPEPAVAAKPEAPAVGTAPAKTPPAAPAKPAAPIPTPTPTPAPATTPAPAAATSPPPSIFVPERPPGGVGHWPSIATQPVVTPPRPGTASQPTAPAAPDETPPPAAPRPYWPAPPALPVSPSSAAPGAPWMA